MSLTLKEAWCKVAEWCENPPWITELPPSCWRNNVYTITGTNGVNELGWTNDAGIEPPGSNSAESIDDAFPGGPNGGPAPLPGHPNVPTQSNVVADFDESGTNTGGQTPDQWHYWAWLYVAEGESVDLRENDGSVDQGIAYLGECKGNGTEITRWPYASPYRGGQFATALGPGFHFVGFAVHDAFAQSGVDVEWSATGAGAWSNVPADRWYTECPTVDCRQVIECDDGAITELDGTPVTLGALDFLGCPPELCELAGGLDEQMLSTTEVGGETTAITISNGNTVPILHNHPTVAVPQPATTLPVPDNEVDAAIRAGQVGASLDYARADHNHPVRRQGNPGDPIVTAGGNAVITQSLILDRWSTEETYEYALRIRVNQPAGTGWGWVNIPTIAGFQQPQISLGTYRSDSNAPQRDLPNGDGGNGATPRGPVMSHEAHHWSSTRRLYLAYSRRDEAIGSMFIEPVVRYIRL